jgi:hypothetical protein
MPFEDAPKRDQNNMPHYFFHLRCGGQLVRDERGDELADDHVALERAVEAARALLQGASDHETWSNCLFEVTDGHGETIWRMPVLDAVAVSGE